MSGLLGAGIAAVGGFYVVAPGSAAGHYGVAPLSAEAPFVMAKGVRDVVSGLLVLALSLVGERRSLGLAVLSVSAVATGDALVVLRRGGSAATAGGVHGASAVLTAATGLAVLQAGRAPTGGERS